MTLKSNKYTSAPNSGVKLIYIWLLRNLVHCDMDPDSKYKVDCKCTCLQPRYPHEFSGLYNYNPDIGMHSIFYGLISSENSAHCDFVCSQSL